MEMNPWDGPRKSPLFKDRDFDMRQKIELELKREFELRKLEIERRNLQKEQAEKLEALRRELEEAQRRAEEIRKRKIEDQKKFEEKKPVDKDSPELFQEGGGGGGPVPFQFQQRDIGRFDDQDMEMLNDQGPSG